MPKVCVIGSVNMDVVIQVDHMPEGGENVYSRDVTFHCGGKGANQAITLSSLGVDTLYFGCLGNDVHGDELFQNLKTYHVDCSHVLRKNCNTGTAYIILENSGENRIIVDPGANEQITPKDIREKALPLIEQSDLVLIQLEITLESISEIIAVCKELGKKLIIDAGPIRGCTADRLAGVFCISPNRSELGALLGKRIETEEDVLRGAKQLLQLGVGSVLVKLGGKGSLYVDGEQELRVPAHPVEVVDTTGAGDTFMAGYASMILEGKSPAEAMEFANRCGAFAVTQMGACSGLINREKVHNL